MKKALLILLLILCSCGGSKSGPPPVYEYNVRYYVDGFLLFWSDCNIKYQNLYGLNKTEIRNGWRSDNGIDLPWSYDFKAKTGDKLYLEVYNMSAAYTSLDKTMIAGIMLDGEEYISDSCIFSRHDEELDHYIDTNCDSIILEMVL